MPACPVLPQVPVRVTVSTVADCFHFSPSVSSPPRHLPPPSQSQDAPFPALFPLLPPLKVCCVPACARAGDPQEKRPPGSGPGQMVHSLAPNPQALSSGPLPELFLPSRPQSGRQSRDLATTWRISGSREGPGLRVPCLQLRRGRLHCCPPERLNHFEQGLPTLILCWVLKIIWWEHLRGGSAWRATLRMPEAARLKWVGVRHRMRAAGPSLNIRHPALLSTAREGMLTSSDWREALS